MANNGLKIPRAHLIMGLCVPLAVVVGYFLAEPVESSSLAVLLLVLSVLSVPLLMRWYHPLLVFSQNAAFALYFVAGNLPLWVPIALIGFLFVVLDRCVDSQRRLMVGGSVAWSLVCLAVVIILTAQASGGIGMKAFGSATYGGRRYMILLCAIVAYFVFVSRRIPSSRAGLYGGIFFLSGITSLLSLLSFFGSEKFPVLFMIVPSEIQAATYQDEVFAAPIMRVISVITGAGAICLFMLARYGIRGILDKYWRLAVMLAAVWLGLYGGFRSFISGMALICLVMFFCEGLHKSRYLFGIVMLATLLGSGLLAFSHRMPMAVQRALSFLPIEVDPLAKEDAMGSWLWRLDMWKAVSPQVPRYLFRGKGYVIDPTEMYQANLDSASGFGYRAEGALIAGDYHNGPLSILIPFGIWGAGALTWFLIAAVRILYRNYRYGNPALKTMNTMLFSCFLAKIGFFLFFFGGLESDLPFFAGVVGMGVSLNGEQKVEEPTEEMEPEIVPELVVARRRPG